MSRISDVFHENALIDDGKSSHLFERIIDPDTNVSRNKGRSSSSTAYTRSLLSENISGAVLTDWF